MKDEPAGEQRCALLGQAPNSTLWLVVMLIITSRVDSKVRTHLPERPNCSQLVSRGLRR